MGYTSNEDEYRALMASGVNFAQSFGLMPGMALSAAQMDALTSDIVWLVDQVVTLPDGSAQHVLAPVVYLAHANANDLQPSGALIAADDVEIHATGSVTNSAVIKGGTQTVITGTDILNRGGAIGSSGTNGTTMITATNDVVNASGHPPFCHFLSHPLISPPEKRKCHPLYRARNPTWINKSALGPNRLISGRSRSKAV